MPMPLQSVLSLPDLPDLSGWGGFHLEKERGWFALSHSSNLVDKAHHSGKHWRELFVNPDVSVYFSV